MMCISVLCVSGVVSTCRANDCELLAMLPGRSQCLSVHKPYTTHDCVQLKFAAVLLVCGSHVHTCFACDCLRSHATQQ